MLRILMVEWSTHTLFSRENTDSRDIQTIFRADPDGEFNTGLAVVIICPDLTINIAKI